MVGKGGQKNVASISPIDSDKRGISFICRKKLRVDATSRPPQKKNYICLVSLNGQGLSLKGLVSLTIFNNSVLMSVVYRRSTL